MIYLDSSVVVALLTPEERSAQALDWFAQSRDPLISSDWLITETHGALGIKQRHHGLSSEARQAAELLQDSALGLRAGDALHLAVALHSRCTQLASFDGRMQQAAKTLGMRPALE
jgi:predicted nucleic acid-binding protein